MIVTKNVVSKTMLSNEVHGRRTTVSINNSVKYADVNAPIELAIVMPIYNPPHGWISEMERGIRIVRQLFADVAHTVVIVNDGSPVPLDQAAINEMIHRNPSVRYLSYKQNRGKGYAVRHGLSLTSAKYYIYTDWDFPFGFDSLREIYNQLSSGKTSLVIGSRKAEYFKKLPSKRRFISKSLLNTNALLTWFRVRDTQAGIKGLDSKARELFLTTTIDSFVFEIEFIRKFLKHKLPYSFVKVMPKEDIVFTNFGSTTIKRELVNYVKLIFNS